MDDREGARPAMDSYRRRSPDRRDRGGRARSRSPVAIDRYQPGRPRDDSYRGRDDYRRRSPPPNQPGIDRYVPGQQDGPPPATVNPLPNPMTLDYQVGFNFFAEWWRVEQQIKEEKERQRTGRRPERSRGDRDSREDRTKERAQIQTAYDAYKEKLQAMSSRNFVHQHKGEEWFKERYDPDMYAELRERVTEYRRNNYGQWEQDLAAGVFDDFTLEGIYKNDSNGAGGVIEKEEGEAIAANEVLGVGDLLPSRGADLRDESAFQPTLLIKTIAPTVSRSKMEEFCKEKIGEGEGGFKWLSLSDPNPAKKCHRIGWVLLHPAPEQAKEDRRDGMEEDGEEVEEPAVAENPSKVVADKAMAAINGETIHDETRGDFTCHVGIHEPPPNPRKKALWDLFSAPERIERDIQLAERLIMQLDRELGEEYSGLARIDTRVSELLDQGLLQPPVSEVNPGRKQSTADDGEMEDGEDVAMDDEDEGAIDEDEADTEDLIMRRKRLDLMVEYLRRVFNFCFFCVFESDSVHELTRKCPGGHLRRPRNSLTTAAKEAARASASGLPFPLKKQDAANADGEMTSPVEEKKFSRVSNKSQQQLQRAFNWVKTFEEKILQIVEPDMVDIKKLGGRPVEEALEEDLAKFVKQEDEAKYRCKVPECTKLFKGTNFWRKHVEKRHEEFFAKVKQDVILINKYVMDPAHIVPTRSDANSNGHFPVGNHAPTGTPRGFNLSNLPPLPSNFNMSNFAAFLSQSGFNSFPGGDGDDRHQTGPMRRQGNRYGSRQAGPYDRQQKDSRGARWNGNSGRLTPPMRQGSGGSGGLQGGRGFGALGGAGAGGAGAGGSGNPRFADAGGGSAAGPREAVQGRSLKSYEDLDAVGGGGDGELNY